MTSSSCCCCWLLIIPLGSCLLHFVSNLHLHLYVSTTSKSGALLIKLQALSQYCLCIKVCGRYRSLNCGYQSSSSYGFSEPELRTAVEKEPLSNFRKEKKKCSLQPAKHPWHVDSRVSAVSRAAVVGKLSTVGP